MADLLLELFSEEIPARMQADAAEHLTKALIGALTKAGLPSVARNFVTPRRLAVIVLGLPAQQADVSSELKGPKIDAPEQALLGFLKKSGMSLEQLEKRDGIYIAKIEQKGKPTADVLKTAIEEILASFPWPKSMRWGSGDVTWVRPLHSILCIFDDKVVPVEFGGVKAGNTTRGHRFLAPDAITITNPAEYEAVLQKAFVIADREARKAEIVKQAEAAASAAGLVLKKDDGLLEEVTGLVEFPVVLTGTVDAKYMDLPKEVLVSEMRAHQKYFALENKDGTLSDKFLITANMKTRDGKAVIAGNERVLRARLADGRFFWDQDRKKPLADWAEGLKTVTFHAKLGSIAEKVTRTALLADKLAEYTKADRTLTQQATRLCKADLVTGMVGEFPELQGIMGRYYASKENAAVADAIRDHYLPLGPSSPIPTAPISITVALADKLDTLISMFAIGEKPTGSKDPFALRRAALGIIRIILENNIRLPLKAVLNAAPMQAIALHKAHDKLAKQTEASLQQSHRVGKYLTVNESACEDITDESKDMLAKSLLDFMTDRLIVQLKDSGIRHDVIKAVVASGDDDFVRVVARAKALQEFLGSDDGKNLLAAYKRGANILSIEEKKDKTTYNAAPDAKLFALSEEKSLNQSLNTSVDGIKSSLEQEKFKEVMSALSKLRGPVDAFFDKVLVNDKNEEIRKNRLYILAQLRTTLDSIANFALIEG